MKVITHTYINETFIQIVFHCDLEMLPGWKRKLVKVLRSFNILVWSVL